MWSCLAATFIVKPSKKIPENMPIYLFLQRKIQQLLFTFPHPIWCVKSTKILWTKFLFHRKSSVREMHHRRKKTKMKKNKQLQRNHTLKTAASNFRRLFALYEGKQKVATSFTSPSWCLRFSYINWTKLFFLSIYVSLVLTERLLLRI